MADVIHFDIDDALDRMLQVFWRRGYKMATTKELAASASLSEGSLYNTFGSKKEIYRRVLDRYVERNRRLLDRIELNPSPLAGLREYWETIASYAADPKRTNGCMVTNAAVAESGDEDIAAFVRSAYARSERTFKKTLDRAIEAGELRPGTDSAALAQFLLHSVQGIRVLSRLNPSRKKMKNIVDGVMSVLDQHRVVIEHTNRGKRGSRVAS